MKNSFIRTYFAVLLFINLVLIVMASSVAPIHFGY